MDVTEITDPDAKTRMKNNLLIHDKTIMFEKANMSTSDVLVMILSFCMRFCLSYEARQEAIEMVKCFVGPDFTEWSISNYYLKQAFDVPDEVISYIFYCDLC